MSELIDDLWTLLVQTGRLPLNEGTRTVLRAYGNLVRRDPERACKETVAEILGRCSEIQLRDVRSEMDIYKSGVDTTGRTPDEVRQLILQGWEQVAQDQRERERERREQEDKQRAILLSELSVLLPRWREVRGGGKLPDVAEKLTTASMEALEQMPLADLQRGMEKLRPAVQEQESEIRRADLARETRLKEEQSLSPVFAPDELDRVQPRPQFREQGERKIDVSEAVLCEYELLRLDLCSLLVALRGRANLGIDADAISVFILGDTEAGKTTTVGLVADMLGCKIVDCCLTKDRDKLLTAYAEAAEERAFALADEVQDLRPADFKILPFLRKGTAYKLPYNGGTETIKKTAVFVMLGKEMPQELLLDPALARRCIFVDLGRGARGFDWMESGTVEGWRQRNPDAADDFVAGENDRFTNGKTPTAKQIAASLGFGTLAAKRCEMIREFVAELPASCKPGLLASDGWRMVVPGKGRKHVEDRLQVLRDALRDEGVDVRDPAGRERRTFLRLPAALSSEARGAGFTS